MHTPFFPPWQRRLAALGRRSVQTLRQLTLHQLEQHLADLIPVHWLSPTEEGAFSRQRVYSLRLTVECFLWQVLKPQTACREVVRQVQALLRLGEREPTDSDTSPYIQGRLWVSGHEVSGVVLFAQWQHPGSRYRQSAQP